MASFAIDLQCEVTVPPSLLTTLETAVLTTLTQQQVPPPAQLTLLLTTDEHIQQLNQDFRQVDAPTDVLSFPAGDPIPGMPNHYLGDIAISVPYATRQASKSNHDMAAELQLLAIHGVLHLLGHDHATPTDKAQMWAAQENILAQLGLAHVTPTE